jgi:sporulation protein YlmC with PRC-barrel domain
MNKSNVVRASEDVVDKDVKNSAQEDLGTIREVMLDKVSGRVAYVVLESGSFLGMGGKLFAIPWNSISYNKDDESFILNVDKDRLKEAPGFDTDHWPDMADKTWGQSISDFYGSKPYWD